MKPSGSQLVRMSPSDQLRDETVANCIGDVSVEVLSTIEIQLRCQVDVLRLIGPGVSNACGVLFQRGGVPFQRGVEQIGHSGREQAVHRQGGCEGCQFP